ncbi:hypothetical protein D3C87_432730 [compost metagenome]|uniref:YqzM family protein n=1 Tax=Paenibacillus zeisoli TaxID=2496267 RepID=A0A433X4V0_9BACL|nr:YqzM family protein [Paenibacillus zeisoli]RUT29119.1 YqzM family protein [Paenibacillus zeisoli]
METPIRVNDPRQHINEEPRNDFGDLMFGFTGMFALMFVIFFGMVIWKFIAS